MASLKTQLTELGTALGLVFDPAASWPDALLGADLPGIAPELWRPVVEPIAVGSASADRDLLLRALDNGRAFRTLVLRGRRPEVVQWSGSAQSPWTSDVPRDLTVDHVYFIQAKYDSTCVLNTSPSNLIDELAGESLVAGRPSWYEEVAHRELGAYYREVRHRPDLADLPDDVQLLDAAHRARIKTALRAPDAFGTENEAYAELCRVVSTATALRWRHRLSGSSRADQTKMLFRMLRIAGGPYWLLGMKGASTVRLAVTDTRSWRDRFDLKRFTVTAAQAGQPQVEWRAEVADRSRAGELRVVEGYCELRWSHGKFQGHPECKVQVRTPLPEVPGYTPMT